jgi:hypothetical protein
MSLLLLYITNPEMNRKRETPIIAAQYLIAGSIGRIEMDGK